MTCTRKTSLDDLCLLRIADKVIEILFAAEAVFFCAQDSAAFEAKVGLS